MKQHKAPLLFISFLVFLSFALSLFAGAAPFEDARPGWKLAVQGWTFRKLTLFETLDILNELDIHYLEAYSGQKLSPEHPDVVFGPGLPDALKNEVKTKLDELGIKLVNFGVVGLGGDNEANEKLFRFAKDMGIETILSEPEQKYLKKIDKLCQKYQIRVGLHNHPKPTRYWDPQIAMKAVRKRSDWMGVSADIGHWMRSGIDIEKGLDLIGNRLVSLHMKDLNVFGAKEAHDVPWGQGEADMRNVLLKLDHMGFMGVMTIEYEHITDHLKSDVAQCVEFFRANASVLAPQWQNVFEEDLSNARFAEGSWEMTDGVLTRKGGGDIWTTEQYDNFILECEFKVAENSNSGIFLRCGDLENFVQNAIEVQIHASTDNPKHSCGAIFDVLAPSEDAAKPAGEWNQYKITCLGNRIYVNLNGKSIINMNLLAWQKGGKNPDGTLNKFRKPLADFPKKGYIGFQDHGDPVWFRNIRIRPVH